MGWRVVNDAMQIMGGEGYMTENEVERIFRDSRINLIVEGANEVMQSFIFAYGGKQLAEQMLGIQNALLWNTDESVQDNAARLVKNGTTPSILRRAIPLGLQLFLGVKPSAPAVGPVHPLLDDAAARLASLVQDHSHYFKMASKWEREAIVTRQAQQARVADNAILIWALTCALSKMDHQLRSRAYGPEFEKDRAAFEHLFDLFELQFDRNVDALRENADVSMRRAAKAAYAFVDTLPNTDFVVHESSPTAKGTGRAVATASVRQFPGTTVLTALTEGATTKDSGKAPKGSGDGAPVAETVSDLDVAKGLG